VKVGDLVVSDGARGRMEGVGIVMEPPRLSADCFLGGAAPDETYRIVKVLWPAGIDEVFEEDIEVVNESR
tara:strand:+ start:95 stop:304 length:210 start_codon:yes stop_codon:yes gene_type:complete